MADGAPEGSLRSRGRGSPAPLEGTAPPPNKGSRASGRWAGRPAGRGPRPTTSPPTWSLMPCPCTMPGCRTGALGDPEGRRLGDATPFSGVCERAGGGRSSCDAVMLRTSCRCSSSCRRTGPCSCNREPPIPDCGAPFSDQGRSESGPPPAPGLGPPCPPSPDGGRDPIMPAGRAPGRAVASRGTAGLPCCKGGRPGIRGCSNTPEEPTTREFSPSCWLPASCPNRVTFWLNPVPPPSDERLKKVAISRVAASIAPTG